MFRNRAKITMITRKRGRLPQLCLHLKNLGVSRLIRLNGFDQFLVKNRKKRITRNRG
jgi:hypothetical protein